MTDPRCDNCGAPAERIVDGIHWCVACSDAAGHVRCGQGDAGCGAWTASEAKVAESPHRDAPRVRVCAACHERAARGETR